MPIVDAVVAVLSIACVFGMPPGIVFLVLRHKRQMAELEVRRMEAEAKLLAEKRQSALPEYVDADDPDAVAAYREARRETERAAARHAARLSTKA
jgi:hypothetical protein